MDVFSHPWLGGLFGDDETQALISDEAQLHHMLAVEAAFARALGQAGSVPKDAAEQTVQHIEAFKPDLAMLRAGMSQDGVVVPALVRTLKERLAGAFPAALHTGMTSQDVIDTAQVLSLKPVCSLFANRIAALIETLNTLEADQGANRLMGRTRMQAALPATVGNRLRSWHMPLSDHLVRLEELKPRLLCLQLGGAVGDRAALAADAPAIAAHMASSLGLNDPPACWHTRRDGIAEFASWLSLVTGTLGKAGQDIALMAQQGIDEIELSGGGTSSAMPHKQNPILAELLVTLARFNATQLSGVHQALVHEQERSGVAWTLEWMIIPQMILSTGRALIAGQELIGRIERIGTPS